MAGGDSQEIRRTIPSSGGRPLKSMGPSRRRSDLQEISLLGGVEDFASHLCETMSRYRLICCRDRPHTIIAVAGGSNDSPASGFSGAGADHGEPPNLSVWGRDRPFRSPTAFEWRLPWRLPFWRRVICWDWCFYQPPSPRQPPATRNTSWPRHRGLPRPPYEELSPREKASRGFSLSLPRPPS